MQAPRPRTLGGALVLALGLALAGAGLAAEKRPYVPWRGPDGTLWRGDQRHASRLPRKAGDPEGVVRLDGFRWRLRPKADAPHQGDWLPLFGEAVVDTRRITGISLLWYPFAPEVLAGHTSLLIEFAPGAVLPGEGLAGHPDLGPPARGIVVSLEALMEVGQEYNFKDGILGTYPVVYCISTWRNYLTRCIDVYQGALHRWRLDLEPAEARAFGEAALGIGMADHAGETYWLTRRSCATAVMDMVIAGLELHQSRQADAARAADIAALRHSNEATQGVDVSELLEAFGRWTLQQAKETVTLTKTRRALGLTPDSVHRESPFGIFINPVMSFPAQISGVLRRRGLIEKAEPDEVYEYRDPASGAAVGQQNTQDPDFTGLSGS